MFTRYQTGAALTAVALLYTSASIPAMAASSADIQSLQQQIQALQNQVNQLQKDQQEQAASSAEATPSAAPQSNDNAFNPAIGVVLNGHYTSGDNHDVTGFQTGSDGSAPKKGLSVDESELNFSANIDDLFAASATASINEDDSATEVELEEAFVRTTGLPYGLGVKAGRFLLPVGYLNEHHAHTDDFSDRPLPSRIFLNTEYKDDGVMASWILPTGIYSEIGGGAFRGSDFPGGHASGNDASWLAYGRIGGDIGTHHSWLLGASMLKSNPAAREGNDGATLFTGDSDLYAASLRYVWQPTGNGLDQEVSLQSEYFWRNEKGAYDDTVLGTGPVADNAHSQGWYGQVVYKFDPAWRVGARYSRLMPGATPAALTGGALDSHGHDPWESAAMIDWTHSEFSRLRLQYGHAEPASGENDDRVTLQYIMSIGAHPAHIF